MKNLIYAFVLTFLLFSCDDEDKDPILNASEEELVNTVENSVWRISLFIEDGKDETSDYSGITFNFLPAGKIEAFNGGQLMEEGTWKTLRDDGKLEFWITFTQNEILEEISDDWYVLSMTATKIEMEDDNDQFIDKLTLQKK
ncbi:hypothetical protein ACFOSV_05965 [Algoriphagus namhaensis]|uniref:Lipocalin-like domain-containing protein n=1 Tax=Algoriphagus namhaensis TaxID=915353 RepID=A0ABV8APV5_9BACT